MIFNWTKIYHNQNPNVVIKYSSVGSGAGQRAFMNKTDDFDATDAPLQPIQRPLTPNVLHIPETIGSVTLSYNVPLTPGGPLLPTGLNLTGNIIAQIYTGQILFWNDPQIQSINPGVTLPNHNITTVHRQDSSGTTFVFTSFLSLDSPSWNASIGHGTTVAWPGSPTGNPIAITGNGNGGVAQAINTTQYSIGYVELNYALQNGFHVGNIQNPAGNYIAPSLQTTGNAVQNSVTTLPPGSGDWSTVSMLNAAGAQSYPIASFTYFLVYRELNVVPSMDLNETFQATALINFLYWVVNQGQQYTSALSYVPLPLIVRQIDNASIGSITFTTPSKINRTIHLSESASGGWNGTAVGPGITIYSGDTMNFIFNSTDGQVHQWYVDYNNNGVLDPNEQATASDNFTSTTPTPNSRAIVPAIGINVPRAGNYTYRDRTNPANSGNIEIRRQIVAASFPVPSALSGSTAKKLDSSKVTTVGTLIVNIRTLQMSGNITEVAVDATSGSITFQKTYAVSNLQLHTVPFGPGFRFGLLFNAQVAPYALSSIVHIIVTGVTPSLTVDLTREVDIAGNGVVTIVDIGIVNINYGRSIGQPNYNPQADLIAGGLITIVDISIEQFNYGAPVYR